MTCVPRIERALVPVPDVVSATVNLATGRAHGAPLPAVGSAALLAAVIEAGYAAAVHAPEGLDAGEREAEARAAEIAAFARDAALAAALTLALMVMEMGAHPSTTLHHAIRDPVGQQGSWLLQSALVAAVMFWPGLRFHTKSRRALPRLAPDMNSPRT